MSHKRRDKPIEQLRRTWTSTEDLEETLQGMFAPSTTPRRNPSDTCLPSLSTPVKTCPAPTGKLVSTPVDTIVNHIATDKQTISTPVETSPVETSALVATPVGICPMETQTHVSTPVNSSPVETMRLVSTGVQIHDPVSTPVKTDNMPSIQAGDAMVSTPVDTMVIVSTPVDTGQVSGPLQRFLADRPLFISSVGKRLFRPKRPSDAHTDGEDRLYKVMWAGSTRSDSNVRIYSASVAALARAMGREGTEHPAAY